MKVALRPLAMADGAQVLAWRNSPEVAANMYTDHLITEAEHAAWLAGVATPREDRDDWIIEADGAPVGYANLIRRDVASGRWELGHYIGEASARGVGIGAAVELLILDHAFGARAASKVWAEVLVGNDRAIALHEAFGYQREALFRAHAIKGGEVRDVIGLGILADEWAVARPACAARLAARDFNT